MKNRFKILRAWDPHVYETWSAHPSLKEAQRFLKSWRRQEPGGCFSLVELRSGDMLYTWEDIDPDSDALSEFIEEHPDAEPWARDYPARTQKHRRNLLGSLTLKKGRK